MEVKQDLQASTELMTIAKRQEWIQTAESLCPRFLTPELKVSNYDKDYKLLEVPTFQSPARKIKEGVNQESELDMVKDSILKFEASLMPATTSQLKDVLGKLALHKGIGNYSETQALSLVSDYVRLLADCPYDLLCKACDECILDPNMQYFPQVGRIRDKMGREMTLRQLYLGRLRKIVKLSSHVEQRQEKPRAQELGTSLANKFRPK